MRHSLSILLDSKGYAVKSYASATDFLAAAPSLPAGCLIVDVRMPEMDGLELQQRLIERNLGFPLIVITGHGDVPLAVRAMKAGAIEFLEKRFASEAILVSLEAAFARLGAPSERHQPRLRLRASWTCSRCESAKCSRGYWQSSPTNRLHTVWASARGRLRSTARALWTKWERAAFPNWSGSRWPPVCGQAPSRDISASKRP